MKKLVGARVSAVTPRPRSSLPPLFQRRRRDLGVAVLLRRPAHDALVAEDLGLVGGVDRVVAVLDEELDHRGGHAEGAHVHLHGGQVADVRREGDNPAVARVAVPGQGSGRKVLAAGAARVVGAVVLACHADLPNRRQGLQRAKEEYDKGSNGRK